MSEDGLLAYQQYREGRSMSGLFSFQNPLKLRAGGIRDISQCAELSLYLSSVIRFQSSVGGYSQYHWMVDLIAQMIEVFELKEDSWVLADALSHDQVVHLPPFEVLPFDLTVLWA